MREYLLGGTNLCGLKLLQHVLLEIKDHAHLVSTMKEGIGRPTANFQGNSLDRVTEELRLQKLQDLVQEWQNQSPLGVII